MRHAKNAAAFIAWLSLFALQLSGLHTHANENGLTGVPETGNSHIHSHYHDSSTDDLHNYLHARDVPFFEFAATDSKLPMAILALILLFGFYLRARTVVNPGPAYPILSGRHTRWRPPLRAPPQPAHI